jgi:uncharacterized membrane protein
MKRIINQLLQTHGIFAVIALAFGTAFIFVIPPLWGVDEATHFDRVYQLSTGQLTEKSMMLGGSNTYGGVLPTNLISLGNYVIHDIANSKPGVTSEVDSIDAYKSYTNQHFSKSLHNVFISGTYFPLAYSAPTVGVLLSKVAGLNIGYTILAARLSTLFAYVTVVGFALYLIRKLKSRWLVFLVALLPMSLFQASIVNIDSTAIALSLLLFALLVRFWIYKRTLSRLEIAMLTLVATGLALTKPNYVILSIAAVFIPNRSLSRSWRIKARTLILILPVLAMIAWDISTARLIRAGAAAQLGWTVNSVDLVHQTKFILIHPFQVTFYAINSAYQYDWFATIFGLLGYNFVIIPSVVIAMLVSTLVIAALYGQDQGINIGRQNNKQAYIFTAVSIVTVTSILYTFYAVNTPIGARLIAGVQGRYFVPVLPFLFYGVSRFIPIKVLMSQKATSIIFPSISTISLVISALVYYKVTYL